VRYGNWSSELRHGAVVACAASAGIHGALVPAHLAEGVATGAGFAAATAALAACAVWLTRGAAGPFALVSTAVVLAGLIASYALATTTGVPLLHPEAEPVDNLALGTKAVEAVGLVAALGLIHGGRRAAPGLVPHRERTA
jgi:hypothetical protein